MAILGGLLFFSCGFAMELLGIQDSLAYALMGAVTAMIGTSER